MEDHTPNVSVLMTAYKGNEHFLPAVESVLEQTYEDLELVIVLDPHPDDICKNTIEKVDDERIRLIINQERKGLVPSRNIALKAARGNYVAVQDSDDISHPDRLEKEVEFLDNETSCLLVGSPCDVITDKGEVIRKGEALPDQEQLYYNLLFANQFPHSSVMFRKEILEKVGGYREELDMGEDYDLFLRIMEHGKVHMLDETLIKWREHKASTTSSKNDLMEKIVLEVIQKNISRTLDHDISVDDLAVMIDNSIKGRRSRSIKRSLEALEDINRTFLERSPSWLDRVKLKRIAKRKFLSLLTGQIVNNRIGVSLQLLFGNIKHWPGLAAHVLGKGSGK